LGRCGVYAVGERGGLGFERVRFPAHVSRAPQVHSGAVSVSVVCTRGFA
jgi:hypothetical protein